MTAATSEGVLPVGLELDRAKLGLLEIATQYGRTRNPQRRLELEPRVLHAAKHYVAAIGAVIAGMPK